MKDKKRAWELLDLINPIHHGETLEKSHIYKVESYVMAGDVYTADAHIDVSTHRKTPYGSPP